MKNEAEPCDHDWIGSGVESDDGLTDASTCSKCEIDALTFTLLEEARATKDDMPACVTCKKPIESVILETHPKAKRCAECSKKALAKISERVDTALRSRRRRSS